MNRYKTWVILFLSTAVLMTGSVWLFNLAMDPYGIWKTDFSRQRIEPNKNFIKMQYVLKHPAKFDSFLFGSSRVNHIDLRRIKTVRYYNMTYSEGLPKEHLENIKVMLDHGIAIKHLVIALDDFSYRIDPASHYNDNLTRPHPSTRKQSFFEFYFSYLNQLMSREVLTALFMTSEKEILFHTKIRKVFDLEDSGRVLCYNCDDLIDSHLAEHFNAKKFSKPFHPNNLGSDRTDKVIGEMTEIKRIAQEHNIHLVVFINPIHQTTYLDTDIESFNRFKRKLSSVTQFYDFSGLNSITTDNRNFYETSHYRVKVGNLILARIFGDPAMEIPPDFGVLVTQENVEAHLSHLAYQVQTNGVEGIVQNHP